MKEHRYIVRAFLITAVLLIHSADTTGADKPVRYYKTGDVGENLKDFVNYYSPQVRAYSRFWEEMSGEKVAKAGLYFIHTKQFVPVVI